MRWPGIEPGSTAWKAAMLTIIPPMLDDIGFYNLINYLLRKLLFKFFVENRTTNLANKCVKF
jgi:hypothetical protein